VIIEFVKMVEHIYEHIRKAYNALRHHSMVTLPELTFTYDPIGFDVTPGFKIPYKKKP